uniref:Bromo domain-containing protein n=1 Tax=Arundo donax TaxID=35708 RepID=A0A0A9DUP9_ARUDO
MDFSTIREKLLNDSYSTVEQFENDVFLLTSNAMSYNSADTIYYRQARSIEALAKKDFENLRQPSDEEDEQPKPPARRGRPPKNPKMDDDVSPDLSSVKTNKPEDNAETIRKRPTGDRTRNTNMPTKDSSTFHSMLGSFSAKRTDKIGDYSGSSKWGKKPASLDDERRSTYDQHYAHNSSLFSALDDERKLLLPVGLQQQYAYARSVARFAAKLGPVGWDIAANRIRRALPPGTNFGPGWVLDGEPPQNSQWPPVVGSTNPSPQSTTPPSNMTSKNDVPHHKSGLPSNGNVTGEEHLTRTQAVASTSAVFDKSSEIASKVIKYENGAIKSCGGMDNTGPAPPLQHNSHSREIHTNINGFTSVPNTLSQFAGQGIFGSAIPMTHAQVLGMFSGVNGRANGYIHGHPLIADSVRMAQNGDVGKTTTNPVQDANHDRKTVLPLHDNNSAPPSLNAGVQSSASPPRGKVANPKHPDLALQL